VRLREFGLVLALLASAASAWASEKVRRDAISFDVLTVSEFRSGGYQPGAAFEDAVWKHLSWTLNGRVDLAGNDVPEGFFGLDLGLGARLRPWVAEGLDGFFVGTGLHKQLAMALATNMLTFSLYQSMELYAEGGWQWVLDSGLKHGPRLMFPYYDDRSRKGASYVDLNRMTLAWTVGYAW
jgi:hypothetical protein